MSSWWTSPTGSTRVTVISGDWIAPNNTTVSVEGSPPTTLVAGTAEFAVWTTSVTVADGQMNVVLGGDGRANGIEITQLFPPTGLAVTSLTVLPEASVELAWDPVDGAEGYHIYRRLPDTGDYARVGSSETPQFTDADGALELGLSYEYAVTQARDGNESDRSTPVTVTIADDTLAPHAPAVTLETDRAANTFTLVWPAVEDAVHYDVYRAYKTEGNPYVPYERISTTEVTRHMVQEVTPAEECCYAYYYRVYAVGPGGRSGPGRAR